MREVTAKEAKQLLDEGARMVDVRERDEWLEMRVPGVELVPLSGYEHDPAQVPRGDTTIFICARGVRSQTAASIYEDAHHGTEALSVKGGIGAWAARAFPVEIGPPS